MNHRITIYHLGLYNWKGSSVTSTSGTQKNLYVADLFGQSSTSGSMVYSKGYDPNTLEIQLKHLLVKGF